MKNNKSNQLRLANADLRCWLSGMGLYYYKLGKFFHQILLLIPIISQLLRHRQLMDLSHIILLMEMQTMKAATVTRRQYMVLLLPISRL